MDSGLTLDAPLPASSLSLSLCLRHDNCLSPVGPDAKLVVITTSQQATTRRPESPESKRSSIVHSPGGGNHGGTERMEVDAKRESLL